MEIVKNIPLYTNEQNIADKKLIVLSPSSLPFDDNPTEDSPNLVDSNTIYELSETLNTTDNTLSGKLETLEEQVPNIVPIGTIIAFAANKDKAPIGYIICNGAEVSRTSYAKLFAAIGTTYGAGNGKTTFKLPNLTNKFIMGSGTAGTNKSAGLPNITGSLSDAKGDDEGPFPGIVTGTGAFAINKVPGNGSDGHSKKGAHGCTFNASRCSSIYGNSNTVQPPAVTMRFYIKYK